MKSVLKLALCDYIDNAPTYKLIIYPQLFSNECCWQQYWQARDIVAAGY